MAKARKSNRTPARANPTSASLTSSRIGIPIPTAETAIDAIGGGKANILAAYLTHAARPDAEVIRHIVVALTGGGRTGYRLKFERRSQGRPRVDPLMQALDEDEIFRQVELKIRARRTRRAAGESAYGLVGKAIADVAKSRRTTPRSVREVYDRVRRRRAGI
jgi:hypothetical protein